MFGGDDQSQDVQKKKKESVAPSPPLWWKRIKCVATRNSYHIKKIKIYKNNELFK